MSAVIRGEDSKYRPGDRVDLLYVKDKTVPQFVHRRSEKSGNYFLSSRIWASLGPDGLRPVQRHKEDEE